VRLGLATVGKPGTFASIALLWAAALAGCATPAVEVKVPTMSVPEAWNATTRADFGLVEARVNPPQGNAGLPYPVISAPDIRLAYIKPWKDEQGNRHFGSWVAIQVNPPRWVSPGGALEGIGPRGAAPVPSR
jgi:hypothetical protein